MADQEPLDLAACRADIERAHTEVGDIAHDGRDRWRMSIPARPDRDSDLLISTGLAHGDRLADEVARLRAGEADQDAEPGVQRTPAQWLRRFNDAKPEQRLAMAEAFFNTLEDSARCFQRDHEGRLAHLEGELSSRIEQHQRAVNRATAAETAIADVRRLCDMTIATSCRAQAIHQAEDTLAVLDRALTETTIKQTCTCGDIHEPGWLLAPENGRCDPIVEDLKRAMSAAFHPGRIAQEVLAERRRQFEKFGESHYPDGTGRSEDVVMAKLAKAECKANSPAQDNWRDILREEVYEAFAETDRVALRAELVQIAAVVLAWIEDIDSRSDAPTEDYA